MVRLQRPAMAETEDGSRLAEVQRFTTIELDAIVHSNDGVLRKLLLLLSLHV